MMKKDERKELLARYGLLNVAKGMISHLAPADIIPKLFLKLRNDPEIELIYDSQTEVLRWPRLFLYSNSKYLLQLSKMPFWCINSSYSSGDLGGMHLFSVQAVTKCCVETIPLAYVVLSNKSIDSYQRAFRAIQNVTPGFNVSNYNGYGYGSCV